MLAKRYVKHTCCLCKQGLRSIEVSIPSQGRSAQDVLQGASHAMGLSEAWWKWRPLASTC